MGRARLRRGARIGRPRVWAVLRAWGWVAGAPADAGEKEAPWHERVAETIRAIASGEVGGAERSRDGRRDLDWKEAPIHVLGRAAFGHRPGQVEKVRRTGWKKWLRKQLHPERIDDGAMEERVESPSLGMSLTDILERYKQVEPGKPIDAYPPLSKSLKATIKKYKRVEEEKKRSELRRCIERKLKGKLERELYDATLLRAVYSKRQLYEVIVNFWRNHLYVGAEKVPYLMGHYEENVIREHAFGSFEDLLMASAKHPAMLKYLDNAANRAGGVNENYAQELMELHTLGADNYYDEQDVMEVAQLLTGWTCGWHRNGRGERIYGFRFDSGRHASGPVKAIERSLPGNEGIEDGEKLIEYLAHHKGTARFISKKLCRYLVADQPPEALVRKTARVFQRTDGDLRKVYKAILFSDAFVDVAHYKSKFKTPFESVVSALRATDARVKKTKAILDALRLMGEPLYHCDQVTGYEDRARAWLDPGVIVYRWDFAIGLVEQRISGVRIPRRLYLPWARKPSERATAEAVRKALVPGRENERLTRRLSELEHVRGMVGLALGSPAFQQQ